MREKITAERVRDLLHYDPDTGKFRWRVHRGVRGPNKKPTKNNYPSLRIDGVACSAHRLAWLYVTGLWPEREIDHINGQRADNRWANLRPATHKQNMANKARPTNNKTGFKGVHKRGRKWLATITTGRRQIALGSFDAPEAAHDAYVAAAQRLFGDFARAA